MCTTSGHFGSANANVGRTPLILPTIWAVGSHGVGRMGQQGEETEFLTGKVDKRRNKGEVDLDSIGTQQTLTLFPVLHPLSYSLWTCSEKYLGKIQIDLLG